MARGHTWITTALSLKLTINGKRPLPVVYGFEDECEDQRSKEYGHDVQVEDDVFIEHYINENEDKNPEDSYRRKKYADVP
jgi:hypothetical protein